MRTRLVALEIAGFESVSMMVSLRPCPILGEIAVSGPGEQGFARRSGFRHQGGSFVPDYIERTDYFAEHKG